ncbi:MAG: hypothetical protein ACPGRW_06245 [Flavobacteriaceae bacterium]
MAFPKNQKVIRYQLDKNLLYVKARNESKKATFRISDYLDELEEEQGVTITPRGLNNMSHGLPYNITLLVAMAKKAGLKLEDIIKEVE